MEAYMREEAGQSHLTGIPKFWSSIRPKRCAHSDEKPSEADYPVNFGILLSAPFFHMPLPYGKKVF